MKRPSWLSPPPPEADPRETLLWVRQMEILSGIAGIGFGLALLNEGWWAWLVIAMGLIGLSPWPGTRMILRRAEHDPDVLVHDPEERRRRGRRAFVMLIPAAALWVGAIGYVADGWPAAIVGVTLGGASAAASAWWYLRRHDG